MPTTTTRRRTLTALTAPAALAASLTLAAPAHAADNFFQTCYLNLPSSTLKVTEGITVSGTVAAGWVRIEQVAGPYDSPTVTRDFASDGNGGVWHGPGGPPSLFWRWGWARIPVRTVVSAASESGGGDTCTLWS